MTENSPEAPKDAKYTRRQALGAIVKTGLAASATLFGLAELIDRSQKGQQKSKPTPSLEPSPEAPTASPAIEYPAKETPEVSEPEAKPTFTPEAPVFEELLLTEGRHYEFSHPNFSFNVRIVDQNNFNHNGERWGYKVASVQGASALSSLSSSQETIINLHADYYKGQRLPGSDFIEAIAGGHLKAGDKIRVINKETNQSIEVEFLGQIGPVPASDFREGSWHTTVKSLVDSPDSPAIDKIRKGRNIITFLTCSPPAVNKEYINKVIFVCAS